MLSLVALIRLHAGPLEAALAHEYPGTYLTDVGTPKLTWRRLGVLVRHLPPGSALHQSMYPNLAEQYEWGITDYLLANLIDLTAAANWQRENAGLTKEQRPSPRPKPMYRPGVSSSRKTMEQREIEWAARKRKHEAEREQSGSN